MAFQDIVAKAQTYYPNLQIRYKDQSLLMKIVGKILFFNPSFMSKFVTTIGSTIYFPNEAYTTTDAGTEVLLHELTHIYDESNYSITYMPLYLFPQILALPALLLFLLSWKLALIIFLILLLPLPAPGRTYFERRAYFIQLYASKQIFNYDNSTLMVVALNLESYFVDGSYYWMWPFGLLKDFEIAAAQLINDQDIINDTKLKNMIDNLIVAAKL